MKEKLKRIFNNKTKFFVIVALALIIISLFGGTYAVFQRIDEAQYDSIYSTGNLQIVYDDTSEGLGGPINIIDAIPLSDVEGAALTPYKFKITNTGNLNYEFDLKLVIDATYVASHGCADNQISANYIKIKLNDESPVLLSSLTSSILKENIVLNVNDSFTYELRVWLAEGAPNTEIGKHYHGKITTDGSATENSGYFVDTSYANPPKLAEGMIPVMYNGTSWVKADYYDSTSEYAGYNYQNKEWANAVTVTNATRNTYMNANAGEPVLESDILAYFVWIPRYKYELFNPTYTSDTSPQLINVVFESGTSTTGTVTCTYDETGIETCTNKAVGNYYTHPAFTFGNISLTGIWVGKFETAGTAETPTIKPNITPLTNQNVSTQFVIAKILGTNTYLTDKGVGQIDSHMMKNIERGAFAYLKQSAYGLGTTDIGLNNYINGSYMTGCGAAAESPKSTTCNQYNTITGMLASTTGNITGVYDASGGVWEYVMGNYQKYSGYTAINYTAEQNKSILDSFSGTAQGIINSGFNGPVYGKDLDGVTPLFVTDGVPFPESKYYDLYLEDDTLFSHLGDAMGETKSWYTDLAGLPCPRYPWLMSGGDSEDGTMAGIFTIVDEHGHGRDFVGFRNILVYK